MIRPFLAAAASLLLLGSTGAALAQAGKSPLVITEVKPTFELSPEFNIGVGPQRRATSQPWLWVEVAFTYQPVDRNAPPLDDLTLNYYILLNNSGPQNPTGTLLTGSVVHTGVLPGTGNEVRRSVMMVSPQVLSRFFGGKIPNNANSAVRGVGVTASVQGQLVAQLNVPSKAPFQGQWWTQLQQGPPGLVLSKDQTPFAPLFYDYFEAIKGRTPGNP